ncbi:TolC family protein [Caballeronia sp. EK]|uniref:TolC family protein n=1 Tax=Caballeronia sp. EK TaxID=2767469 RepID=UPI0035C8FC34
MEQFSVLVIAAAALACGCPVDAQTLDVFQTRSSVADAPAARMLDGVACRPAQPGRPLELGDAILQAVCANPQARQAWAETRAQAAAVGVADAAYLPVINGNVGVERDTLSTTYGDTVFGSGLHSKSQNTSSKYGMLTLSWVLVDFDKRDAARRQARALLAAANATEDDTLQTVFFNAARAFYALRDARASLEAAQRTEGIAQESLAESSAKHAAGVGTLADELQARTSYRRAVLDRVSAEGDERAATGALAVAIGLEANAHIRIGPQEPVIDVSGTFNTDVDQLIEEAKRRRPKLVAARAVGRPTISLAGSLAQNNPSYQQQPQSVPITGSRGSTIGIQLTIPLFEGFASGYRVAQAQAQADAEEAVLHDTELQVSLDVWKNYQSVRTDSANLANSQYLVADAQSALDIARGRYKEGVGTFTELLNTQTVLADAQKQRVLAVSKWRTARLGLAASLGKLGL